jgi:predicted PurR-regulated permease PerM
MTPTLPSAQSRAPKWLPWLVVAFVILAFIYAVRGILLPFVVGMAIAYLLDPVVDRLEKHIPRWLASGIVLILFFMAFAGIFVAIAPILRDQLAQLASAMPSYLARLQDLAIMLIKEVGGMDRVRELLEQSSSTAFSWITDHVTDVLAGGVAVFGVLGLMLISPVVAFYMVRDYDTMVARIDSWIPPKYEPTVRKLMREADVALSGFVRGQFLVCVGLAFIYALGWSLIGLDYGLLLGLIAGLLAFIPYVGQALGTVLAVVTALGQFGPDPMMLALTIGVYGVAQTLESAVLVPKLMGDQIGLHAVWVLFAVLAGGELMGFVGVLIAVPVAAVIAVLARWLLQEFLRGPLYHLPATTSAPAELPTTDPPPQQP